MNAVQPEVADNNEREQQRRRRRRIQMSMGAFAACIGLTSFLAVAGKPRFETYHRLDVIRLMTSGAGIGIALVSLIPFLQSSSPGSETKKE